MNKRETKIEELRDAIFEYVEIELEESLPLCSRENEILFYFNSVEKGGYIFLDEIYHIYYVHSESGEVVEVDVSDIIADDVKEDIEFSLIPYELDEDIIDQLEEEYEELYQWFVELDYKENIDDEEKEKIKRFKEVFDLLVPDSMLKEIYYSLGYEMFNYIEDCLA